MRRRNGFPSDPPPARRRSGEGGSILLPVLLLMMLFTAIAAGAAIVVRMELFLQERFRQGAEAFYAADAALATAIAELRRLPSWTAVLDGSVTSSSSRGGLSDPKSVPGGVVLVCCGAGSLSERLARETQASPARSRRTVQWQPFLWTPFDALGPWPAPGGLYVAVWVGDDEADGDGAPGLDSNGVVIVRAEAVHPSGTRRIVEAYVAQPGPPPGDEPVPLRGVAVLGWREVR